MKTAASGDAATPTAGTHTPQNRSVIAGGIGNMLEWFDFAAYGYFSAALGRNFFPSDNHYTSILSALAVFAAAFFMRPLGGILFGHVGDRYGRRKALVLSAGLMTVSTFAIGCLPTYETAGVLAPILLVTMRLAQGLSVGGEYTSSAIFLVESGDPKRRGLLGSVASMGACVGIMAGSLLGLLITTLLTADQVQQWGWRIPFLLGLALGGFILLLRQRMGSEPEPNTLTVPDGMSPLRLALATSRSEMVRAFVLNLAPAASFYIVFVYLVTYMENNEGIPGSTAFVINTLAMALLVIAVPVIGSLSDTVGRKTVLTGLALGLVVLSWPLFLLIDSRQPGFILLGQAGFALLVGGYTGVMPATLVELLHRRSRCTAMAVSYNASMALVGGTAPMIAAALAGRAQVPHGPALYIAAMAAVSLMAILTLEDATGRPDC